MYEKIRIAYGLILHFGVSMIAGLVFGLPMQMLLGPLPIDSFLKFVIFAVSLAIYVILLKLGGFYDISFNELVTRLNRRGQC